MNDKVIHKANIKGFLVVWIKVVPLNACHPV